MSSKRNGVRASVRAAASAAPAPAPVPAVVPGGCGSARTSAFHDDHLHGPDGRIYRRCAQQITPGRAQGLLRAGALMVVDDCGCGGYCGLQWPDAAERALLARRPPSLTKRRGGCLQEWRTADGRALLLQDGDVRWP